MRILLFETSAYYPTSPLFLEALASASADRGYRYHFFDEAASRYTGSSLAGRAANRVSSGLGRSDSSLNRQLLESAIRFKPNLVLIGKGARLAPDTLASIKRETGALLVNFASDDPFNPRVNTANLVKSIPMYDLYACSKRAIVSDVLTSGCLHPMFIPFAYKPSLHFYEKSVFAHDRRFECDVVFIGGCDGDRIPYMETLVRALPDVRLSLYGGYWQRVPSLKNYWRGFAYGREFRLATTGAKIAINLVRRANRDGHVMRSFEIPACRGFMLAERTTEHLEMFEEDAEAAYFESPDELIDKVRFYQHHDRERRQIAAGGYRRVSSGAHTYRDRLDQILATASELLGI